MKKLILFRGFARAALLLLAAIIHFEPPCTLGGEWITLQLPLGRFGHTFSLREGDASSPTINPTSLVELVGGYFNANGNWIPSAESYFTITAYRQFNGPGSGALPFWVHDDSTNQSSPSNQLGLVNAAWRTDGDTSLRFFAVPVSRILSEFTVFYERDPNTYDDDIFYLSSKTDEQGERTPHGQLIGYGFFELWVQALNGETSRSWLIDHTNQEWIEVTGSSNLFEPSNWTPLSVNTATRTVTFVLSTNYYWQGQSNSFTIYAAGQSASGGTPWYDPSNNRWVVSGSVGLGRKFWLTRDLDGVRTGDFWMPNEEQLIGVESVFESGPPEPQWGIKNIYIRDSHNPYQFSVVYLDAQGGAAPNAGVSGGDYLYGWDAQGNNLTIWVNHFWAEIDLSRPWALMEGSTNHGQPDMILDGWSAASTTPPAGFVTLEVPSVRQGHTMLLGQNSEVLEWQATASGTLYPYEMQDPWTGNTISWETVRFDAPVFDFSYPAVLLDQSVGDFSPAFSPQSPGTSLQAWFPSQNISLKISITRWGHDLRIRTPLGETPITSHKVQGDWSLSGGTGWFNSYGYFDASGVAKQSLTWQLVDYSDLAAPRILIANSGDPYDFIAEVDGRDTDEDGLADWYERLTGTNPFNPDTDGDTILDGDDCHPRHLSSSAPGSTLDVFTILR